MKYPFPVEKTTHNSPLGASFAFLKELLDLIYPPICGHCGRVDHVICPYCWDTIDRTPLQRSPLADSPIIRRHVAVGPHAGVLRSAIHALKYEREKRAGELLGHLLDETLENANVSFDIIIPVPLHEARLRERGYNQAKIIALGVSRGTLLSNALERHRYTTSQVNLSAHERQSNVQDAFRAIDTFAGEQVLLIDDVCTTGATLLACAAALQESGVGDIYAATVSYAVD